MKREYYVYILTNKTNRVLYTGVTNNLQARFYQHRNGLTQGFANKYEFRKLVYYEIFSDVYTAIKREKQIKAGSRKRKLDLIAQSNSGWQDLAEEW